MQELIAGQPFGPPYIAGRAAQIEPHEHWTAPELLAWAGARFDQDARFACSFGAEDMVLLDLIATARLPIPVFYLDTGRLHQETYDLIEGARRRYQIQIKAFFPDAVSLEDLVAAKGPNSFLDSVENRKECCSIRKVDPLKKALYGARAWITGQRREQAVTRRLLPKLEIDSDHGEIYKLNPLAEWSEQLVWDYIRLHNVPYNALHDRGFPSIGCACCTRAIEPGEDVRAGRWWWENPETRECGLHAINHHKGQGEGI